MPNLISKNCINAKYYNGENNNHVNSLLKAITFCAKYLVKVESYNILKIISVNDTNYDF